MTSVRGAGRLFIHLRIPKSHIYNIKVQVNTHQFRVRRVNGGGNEKPRARGVGEGGREVGEGLTNP